MKKLAGLVRELEEQLSACTRCGMCQAVCPLYRETAQESSVARGKLAILSGLMEEAFKELRRSLGQISRCLLCGACEANCPSGVGYGHFFEGPRDSGWIPGDAPGQTGGVQAPLGPTGTIRPLVILGSQGPGCSSSRPVSCWALPAPGSPHPWPTVISRPWRRSLFTGRPGAKPGRTAVQGLRRLFFTGASSIRFIRRSVRRC